MADASIRSSMSRRFLKGTDAKVGPVPEAHPSRAWRPPRCRRRGEYHEHAPCWPGSTRRRSGRCRRCRRHDPAGPCLCQDTSVQAPASWSRDIIVQLPQAPSISSASMGTSGVGPRRDLAEEAVGRGSSPASPWIGLEQHADRVVVDGQREASAEGGDEPRRSQDEPARAAGSSGGCDDHGRAPWKLQAEDDDLRRPGDPLHHVAPLRSVDAHARPPLAPCRSAG